MKSALARDLRLNDTPHRHLPPPLIRIEKGIPLPTSLRAPKPCPYPFADMAIGDSFAVPVPIGEQPKALSQRIRARLTAYCRLHAEFSGAVRVEAGERSVRCWRVAAPASPAKKAAR
jgi:hypothetical protein